MKVFLPLTLLALLVSPYSSDDRVQARNRKANIILLITDDQDVELGSLDFMPNLKRIFREQGAEFVNGFATTPICCPSRSSIMTGLYVHNHGTYTNNENCSSLLWQQKFERNTFAVHLRDAGYNTGYFGKYLNEYNGSYVPDGWREWMGLIKNSRFYNYSVNLNGRKVKHNDVYHEDYLTDLATNKSIEFLKNSKIQNPFMPFLLVLSFPAPHGPEDSAPQYSSLFANVTTHRTASWNYGPNPDKEWILQHTGKMEPVHVAFTDFLHRRRLQTLQSVDDAVQRVHDELVGMNELDTTYLLFTSDHGYHLGQFGLIKGKNMPYEFDLKVPFLVRGPNIAGGLKMWRPVLNIDIAPTLLDIAGVSPAVAESMDGMSIMPLLRQEFQRAMSKPLIGFKWRNSFLVERGKFRPKLMKGNRFDLQKQKYTKEQRIQQQCEKRKYQSPCQKHQKWECRKHDVGRWRIFKCRSFRHSDFVSGRVDVDNKRNVHERRRIQPTRKTTGKDLSRKQCSIRSMTCFHHDNSHWKTPPFWQLGPFCFCQNANNNSYLCLRTINETHNFLYCEYVTGFVSFYNIKEDPYQLQNAVYLLNTTTMEQLSRELASLSSCKGLKECNLLIPQQFEQQLHNNLTVTPSDLDGAVLPDSEDFMELLDDFDAE